MGIAYVWMSLVGAGIHLNFEESEVVTFEDGPWTSDEMKALRERKSCICKRKF